MAHTIFVGREAPLSELETACARARDGQGTLAFVSGEPGIGKTSLADETCRRAANRGALTLWANCWEGGGAPAFWPWLQLERGFRVARGEKLLRSRAAVPTAEPIALEPGLLTPSPHAGRFQLFHAISSLLRSAADAQPIVVVIDDLQWADEASLEALRFVADDLRDMAAVVLCTYRDVELSAQSLCARMLADVASRSLHIALSGMRPSEIEALIEAVTRGAAESSLVHTLYDHTAGNPFYVRELLRLAQDSDITAGLPSTPESVRRVIGRRFSKLSVPCRALVQACAVVGREFALDVIAELTERPVDLLYPLVNEAVCARVFEQGRETGQLLFAHELLREVAYAELEHPARCLLHRAAGAALERRALYVSEIWEAQVAQHFERAGASDDLTRALEYCLRAAASARRRSAFGDAALLLERAIGLLTRCDPTNGTRRCALFLDLASVQRANGDTFASQKTCKQAADLARVLDDHVRFGYAALGYGVDLDAGRVDAMETSLLREALEPLAPCESLLRSRLLARLSRALMFTDEHTARAEFAESASAMARRLGDPATIACVLYDCHQAFGVLQPAEAAQMALEVETLAEQVGDTHLALRARGLYLGDLLSLGDLDKYRTEVATYARMVREQKQLGYAWQLPMFEANLAMFSGRFEDAERLNSQALTLGRRIEQPGIESWHLSQFATLRFFQGRLSDTIELIEATLERYPALHVFRAALGVALYEAGRESDARKILEQLTETPTRDSLWQTTTSLVGILAHRFGDGERSERVYEHLLPYAACNVRAGRLGVCTLGSISHYLGILSLTAARIDDAVKHLDDAVDSHFRQGNLPMLANSRAQLSEALRRRAQPGDAERGRALRQESERLATLLDIPLVFAQPSEGALRHRQELSSNVVRVKREGEYWALLQGDLQIRLRDSVGLRVLLKLIADPGREFAAVVLRGPHDDAATESDSGELLDETAVAAYRLRLASLDQVLDEAQSADDLGRAEAAAHERALLMQQLSAAVGLGGRSRRAGSGFERARVSVTKALRGAIRKIALHSRELGEHLEVSLQTGHLCSYRPDPASTVRFEVQL